MNLPSKESLVEASLTPAKARMVVQVWVVDGGVWVIEVDAGEVGAGEAGGGELGVGGGGQAVVKVWSAPLVLTPELLATSR
jgi:hypothetical protein